MSERTKDERVQDLERRLQELREGKDKSSPEFQRKQAEVSRDLHASVDRGDLDTKTARNGAVFYDNGGNRQIPAGAEGQPRQSSPTNRERAKEFCNQPGNEHCRTLEQTPGGQWMEKQKLYEAIPQKDADQAWGKLSGQYARNSSGEAHAFVRTDSAQHRVFRSTEQPELQHNRNVTGINYHHVDHGYEMTHRQQLSQSRGAESGPPPRTASTGSASGPPPRGATAKTPAEDAPSPSKGRSR